MRKIYLSLIAVLLLAACTCNLDQNNDIVVVEDDIAVVEETPAEEVVEEEITVVEETPEEVVEEQAEVKTVIKYNYKLIKNNNVK